MEVVWKLHCDVIVEEFHPRTQAKQAQWMLKQSRIILEDETDAPSAKLYIPRNGVSIPVKLMRADFSLHTNFLAEGKCSIRIRSPVNYSVLISNIPAHQLQAAVHFLNAVAASKNGKPNPMTSTSMTGEGDYHMNDTSDHVRKPKSTSSSLSRSSVASKSFRTLDEEDDDDEEDQEDDESNKENARRAALAKSNIQMVKAMVAAKSGVSLPSSPKRFLSPQTMRFLLLPKPERARVLANHPGFKEKLLTRNRNDPAWRAKEVAYEKVLLDTAVSREQREVLQLIAQGKSLFFTGSAGTGKSFLLHKILSCLPNLGTETFPTSTTGITAMNLQGSTILAWAGIGVIQGKENIADLKARVMRNREALQRWRSTKSLLIDEVSMLDGHLFQTLHELAQSIRGNTKPFGGIQLILCGDFLQLPPVSKSSPSSTSASIFAFEASCWSECVPHCIELSQVYRQKNQTFIQLLDEIRYGRCSDEHAELLRECELNDLTHYTLTDGIRPTNLLTLKREVDELNQMELTALCGVLQVFQAKDLGSGHAMEQLTNNCPARARLELKEGAQVILLRNLSVSEGLCNGSRGVVLRFASGTRHPIVRFTNGAEHTITPVTWSISSAGGVTASREQLPLDLAWAISIHKSQGMSLDRARVSLAKCFEYGQAYVALSRLRSLEGLQLIGFDRAKIKAHPKVIAFYERLGEARAQEEVKRFHARKFSPNTLRRMDLARGEPPSSDEKASAKKAADSSDPKVSRIRKRDDKEEEEEDSEAPVQKRLVFPANKKRRLEDSSSSDEDGPADPKAPTVDNTTADAQMPALESIATIVASQGFTQKKIVADTLPPKAAAPQLKPFVGNLMARASLFPSAHPT